MQIKTKLEKLLPSEAESTSTHLSMRVGPSIWQYFVSLYPIRTAEF